MRIMKIGDDTIKATEVPALRETFVALYGRPVSNTEAHAMERNLVGFFDLLLRIDRRNQKGKTNEQSNRSSNKSC